MNRQKPLRQLMFVVLIFIIIVGCNTLVMPAATPMPTSIPPTVTSISPSAVAVLPTPTRQPAPIHAASPIRIVSHESPSSSRLELWLEFIVEDGGTLTGSQMESDLNNGSLHLTLPSGEEKTFEQVPHSPENSDLATDVWLPEGVSVQMSPPPAGALPLNGMSFENFADSPGGPQIRIPLEKLSDISINGQYQIYWQSGGLLSNTVIFNWDGASVTIQES